MRLMITRGRPCAVALFSGAAALLTVVLLCASPARAGRPLQAAPAAAPGGNVTVHATWDAAYVYFAFTVDDTDITGTNSRPLSHPEQDDSVAVYFQTGAARPAKADAGTHAMIVSVAQGFTLLDGDPVTGALVVPAKPDFGIKYGVTLQGTLNHSEDRDREYTVTLAVPFSLLGIAPAAVKPGLSFGFDAVVRSRSAGALTSLAAGVKSEADLNNPSLYTRLTLVAPDGSGGAGAEGINAPEVDPKNGAAPLIDGTYRDLQWPPSTRTVFASPDRPKSTAAVETTAAPAGFNVDFAKLDATAPALDLSRPLPGMQRVLMARYVPTYQADRRRLNVPTRGVFAADGTIVLPDQPITGVGPWFSSDRVSFQRDALAEMRRNGIDVALVQIGGPAAPEGAGEDKTLLVLVTALRELAASGTPAPQIALCLDTSHLIGAPAAAADPALTAAVSDLAQAGGRDLLYGAVRRWFRLIPPEFRWRVLVPQADSKSAIVPAYPVFLATGATANGALALTNVADPDWTDTLRTRFAADFGAETAGSTLIFAGIGSGWSADAAKLAAVLPTTTGKGAGPISSFVIQPGCATSNPVLSRQGGKTYHDAWEAAIAAAPSWYLVDSWNDFTAGSEVTASRQYGGQYRDQTRIYSIQIGGLRDRDVRYLDEDAPRRMYPGQVVTTTVTLQNVGRSILSGADRIGLVYRWRKNGAVVAEGPLKLPLSKPLLPTRTAALPIGLLAAQLDPDGHLAPLPPGDYVVEVDLAQISADGKTASYFSDAPAAEPAGSPMQPLRFPVTINADIPDYVQFSGTETPAVLRAGESVASSVRVRWMAGTALGLTDASLVTQIVAADGKTAVATSTTALPAALPPGQWVTLPVNIPLTEATIPIAPANPELRRINPAAPGGYTVRYLLTRTTATASIPGDYNDTVAVYPADSDADILLPAAPTSTFDAGAKVPINVRIVNRGADRWQPDAYAVGYHWYDADGLEARWMPATSTSLSEPLKPGSGGVVAAEIRAPDHEGDYILALDVIRTADQTFLSTLPGSRSASVGLVPVHVRSGNHLRFLDLGAAFNTSASASADHPAAADFDGKGHSFPAESFPPDQFGIIPLLSPAPEAKNGARRARAGDIYPSGYYVAAESNQQQIYFRYGSHAEGQKNAVACSGQTITAERGNYIGLNLAATATGGGTRPLRIILHYRVGSPETVTATVSDWNDAISPTVAPALSTYLERGPNGDAPGPCTVWHVVYAIDPTRELESITLPNDPAIKVFAGTLER